MALHDVIADIRETSAFAHFSVTHCSGDSRDRMERQGLCVFVGIPSASVAEDAISCIDPFIKAAILDQTLRQTRSTRDTSPKCRPLLEREDAELAPHVTKTTPELRIKERRQSQAAPQLISDRAEWDAATEVGHSPPTGVAEARRGIELEEVVREKMQVTGMSSRGCHGQRSTLMRLPHPRGDREPGRPCCKEMMQQIEARRSCAPHSGGKATLAARSAERIATC